MRCAWTAENSRLGVSKIGPDLLGFDPGSEHWAPLPKGTKGPDIRNMKRSTSPKNERQPMARFQIRELGEETWPDFAKIVEQHNGVWRGCWCTPFHLKRIDALQ